MENSDLSEKLLNLNNSQKMILNNSNNDIPIKQKKLVLKSNEKEKNIINNNNNNLLITKGVEPFSFSRFGVNNMKLKTLKRLEDIRNRYIINKNKVKFDETSNMNKYIKSFENLEIEALDNYTYISTDEMINKIKKINSNSSKMLLNLFTNFILLILLIAINSALVLCANALLDKLGNKINTKNTEETDNFSKFLNGITPIEKYLWILFIEIIVINFIFYFLFSLFISFAISNHYGYKNRNCLCKIIYDFLIEKYIRYLYRMKLLLNKYNKEFNFID